MREDIFKYVKKKYKIEPDYPFPTAQGFPVMRHADNRKWFAIIMDVQRDNLGLTGTERVDVINVKLSESLFADMLVTMPGYFRGYHISRGNWISILLDGTVPLEDICRWIDESYAVTASKREKQKLRPPKKWIVPANPKYYDIEHAFDETREIDWKQEKSTGNKAAASKRAILFFCMLPLLFLLSYINAR